MAKNAENVHNNGLGEGYDDQQENFASDSSPLLGEQARLWPMGRRRMPYIAGNELYWDVGTGHGYNNYAHPSKGNVHNNGLGEGYDDQQENLASGSSPLLGEQGRLWPIRYA